jgi:ERCC4-type nuclease
MTREAIQGTLIHLTLFLGIPIIRSANIEETVQLIRYTATQLYEGNRPGMHASIVKYPRFQLNKKQKAALRILGNFPGIGPEKGMAILSAFKSLKDVFNASQDQLESINGIGPKLADTIYGLINEPFVDQDTITIKPNKR